MTLSAGARIGPYEIVSFLGSGGMAEVYVAKDLRLARQVALKILYEGASADPTRLRRFESEARSASALSHPNIVTIYDAGTSGATSWIAMEKVDGKTLWAILSAGALPMPRLLPIAAQIADGLARAHAAGIVHRDLKPENVMVTREGLVKILDFGVAKLAPTGSDQAGASRPATATATFPGSVVGTIGYMSPEQSAGQAVDFRSDQFSFGCLLYEMTTGRRAFHGESAVDTLAAVLQSDPAPVAQINPQAPVPLLWIIERCLAKDPARRYDSTRDLARDLETLRDRPSEMAAIQAKPPAGDVVGLSRPTPPRSALQSVAVLPFANVSGDPDAEYLCDGIAESIIHSLSRLPRLRVMARSTLSRYKGREIDPQAVGRELKVRAVLTGRVLHRGESLVIKTELVDVSDGSQIWGANFNRKFSDILAVEEEISREISERLRLHATGEEEQRLIRRATESAEAYRLYIQGRFHGDKRSVEGLGKAMALFRQAIELDPAYALPYAGIAEAYNFLGFYTHLAPQEAFPKARAAAVRALELDPSLPEARAMHAIACFYFERDWPRAEKEYRLAIEASPGYAGGHQYYGIFLSAMGRVEEALATLHRADELDPLLLPGKTSLAWGLHLAGRNDEAIGQAEKILEMDPAFIPAENVLSWCYLQMGRWDAATQAARRAVERSGRGTFYLTSLGQCLAASGNREEADAILAELAAASPTRYVSAVQVAFIHVALGQTDLAFESLEKALAEGAWGLAFLLVEPKADPLREDPRFGVLLRRIGLSASGASPQG